MGPEVCQCGHRKADHRIRAETDPKTGDSIKTEFCIFEGCPCAEFRSLET